MGFITLLMLTWCDALFAPKHYLLGHPPSVDNMGEVLAKTGVIVLLWMVSDYKLSRIISGSAIWRTSCASVHGVGGFNTGNCGCHCSSISSNARAGQ